MTLHNISVIITLIYSYQVSQHMEKSSFNAMMSSKHQDWATPPSFVKYVEDYFNIQFDLDAAASSSNHKAPNFFTIEDNSLFQSWYGNVWINPPFGQALGTWIDKIILENNRNTVKSIYCLIPCRPDTKYFHEKIIPNADEIYFIKGRFEFRRDLESRGCALFPSMLVVFRGGRFYGASNSPYSELQFQTLEPPIDARRWKE